MTTPFFHPSTIDIVHTAEHNRVRAEHDLPPCLHGRRSVRDEHGVIEWKSITDESFEAMSRGFARYRLGLRVREVGAHRA